MFLCFIELNVENFRVKTRHRHLLIEKKRGAISENDFEFFCCFCPLFRCGILVRIMEVD
jgi:hypothetical protein